MAESILHCDPLGRIENQQFGDEIEELPVDIVDWWDDILQGVSLEHNGKKEEARTAKGRVARTSFLLCREALGLGQSSFAPSLKYSGWERAPARAKRSGIFPMTISIIARCSRLSWV